MKKLFSILTILAASATIVNAQDVITKKNGEDIRAKVLEVNVNEVKYKLFDEPNGATYIVSKPELLMIRYESGRNEVINQTSFSDLYHTKRDMKYKELKGIYNYKEYIPTIADRYSPAWSGVASFFIPGLGQMICGEVGRGFAYLGGSLGGVIIGTILANASVYQLAYTDYYIDTGLLTAALAVSAGVLALDICAIVDGVRVAKVKNMYEQDLKKTYSFEMDLYPSMNYIKIGNKIQPTTGFTLAMRF